MREPRVSDTVIYRTLNGDDYAAIITGIIGGPEHAVHLQQFVPPAKAADRLDPQWGVAQAPDDADLNDPADAWQLRGTWRYPDHAAEPA